MVASRSARTDIIKSGGVRYLPSEVEVALLEHPAVPECAAIGAPDNVRGEAVCAAVVAAGGDGSGAGGLGIPALRGWRKERMSAHKLLHCLAVVRKLPRNAMGKVTKPALCGLFD